ncbi:MAG: type V CRISPR-associated protein Cas12a/Cpf1 [Candidatus Moranbacteria bacterium]|jgi:hypothetical protein|nr:type V CRISPR-associated protein Cas12a/Cpf1 [Candidatus Moranbacteria bacterium]
MKSENKKTFQDFTNLYSLSKTLRFELRSVGETQVMLEKDEVFKKDEKIQKKYEETKPFIDRLHREFIKEALGDVSLSGLNGYFDIFEKYKKDKKNKDFQKALWKKEGDLRKEIVAILDNKAKEWIEKYSNIKIKKKDCSIFFEESVFEILNERYGNEKGAEIIDEETGEVVSIFKGWKGFTGYFSKFQETRKNFYKDNGIASAVSTRIIDQNLRRFCDNISIFNLIKDKIDFFEVEKNFEKSASEVFSLSFYSTCLLQNGIDSYNEIVGGKTLKNGEKLKGANELINKYRQDNKGEKIPFLKSLDKQLLSEKEKFINQIENDQELLNVLKKFHITSREKIEMLRKLFKSFVAENYNYDLSKVYISKEAFNTISRKWTNETRKFEELLFEAMKAEKLAKYEKSDDSYKFSDFMALSYFRDALSENTSEAEKFWKDHYYQENGNKKGFLELNQSKWEQFLQIFDHEFSALLEDERVNEKGDIILIGYDNYKKDFENIISQDNFKNDSNSKVAIKDFADSVLSVYQMSKYFAVEKKRKWVEECELNDFYTNSEFGYLKYYEDAYEGIVQSYNHIRNYLTQKPYSESKWKLNFENPTLANGWDKNKETDNTSVILRKEGKLYLAIMKKGCNKIFSDKNLKIIKDDSGEFYEKMEYKLFPDPAKMMPKVCFSEKGLNFFKPSDDILEIYNNSEFKKGETFSVQNMQKLIEFYSDCLKKYEGWQCYDFNNVKSSRSYTNNIGEFYRDVAKDGYKISFIPVSVKYIEEKNNSGELYLFEIYNKDFAQGRTGKKNLHTMYFENVFSKDNEKHNFLIKLNGQAEIFYRPKSIEVEEVERNFKRKIVNKKRYTENKMFFHCPINLNRERGEMKARQFNAKINNFLADNSEINIIGIDRGEKHLAYYSVINQKGEILKSGSFNEINGVDYAKKLEERADEREKARRDWQDVEGIKDLKKGYVSQVVRRLADLAIEYNAVIILEDLNMRFKQIRGGIEKSVYQQLEKALIDKLSFLVNKNEMNSEKAGNLLKAYQLCAPFESFEKMGKQTGIVFYTQASYTSKIDPVTGWRPGLYLRYANADKAKKDILKFDSIKWSNEKKRFEFEYDIKKFQTQKEYPTKIKWTVCSNVERFRWDKTRNNNKGEYVHYEDMTNEFIELFKVASIDISRNIKDQIESMDSKENVKFFKDFLFFWGMICQIRNTQKEKEGNENDFILSPVDPLFDSRRASEYGKSLPKNGDENGAYNIARKGIVILNKISAHKGQNGNCEKFGWKEAFISHAEWDSFAQKK